MPAFGHELQHPTDIVFSFEGFRLRGGLTDHHADGIGIHPLCFIHLRILTFSLHTASNAV